jgi:UDP-2-acetamido-2-deoxy-ribo-hexuluronate aminotransferase
MDVLLDVNIVVDICQPRPEFTVDALKVLSRCQAEGSRIWLYAGSVQTLEYSRLRGLMADAAAAGGGSSIVRQPGASPHAPVVEGFL